MSILKNKGINQLTTKGEKLMFFFSGERQTILFSATIDSKVENLASLTLKSNPIVITTNNEKQSTVSGLQQGYVNVNFLYIMFYSVFRK